jgi:predicted ATP-grasp superfamily ATP-dependent carboligase
VTAPGAIVIGGYANGVSALRGLARAGVRTAVILTKSHDVAQHSRYAHETHRLLDLQERPDGLIELLQRQAERWRGWAIIPTNDYALTALAQHRELLSRWYRVTVPDQEIVRRVVDKAETYRLAREVGVDVPRSYGPASQMTASREDILYPVVVKPLESALFWETSGKKLIVARNRAELMAAVTQMEASGIRAEVFDLVPGSDGRFFNYTVYLDRRSQPVAEFSFRKLRKAPPFYGVARAAEVADIPELREPTIALLQRIGWQGMASAEYKLDPRDGRYRLMEINGRCFLTHGLPTRCGVNYPLLAWREHALGEIVSAQPNAWRGVWLHLHADLLYTAAQERGPDWSWPEFIRSYRGPWVDAVWSPEDPIPFLAQWAGTMRKAVRSVQDVNQRGEIRRRFQSMPAPISETR